MTTNTLKKWRDSAVDWAELWEDVCEFCDKHDANPPEPKRKTKLPSAYDECDVSGSVVGHRQREAALRGAEHETKLLWNDMLEALIEEMGLRFSQFSTDLMVAVASCLPSSTAFLSFDAVRPLAAHLDLNLPKLKSHLEIAKVGVYCVFLVIAVT